VGTRFSAPVQTAPGVQPASYKMGTRGKAAGAWRWPPIPSSAEVEERVELYLYSPSGLSWPVIGETLRFTFTLVGMEDNRWPKRIMTWSHREEGDEEDGKWSRKRKWWGLRRRGI